MSIRLVGYAAISGLAVGVLSALGQGSLPFELSSVANSAGAWSLATFLIALANREPRRGVLVGITALVMMLAGYVLASEVRGYPTGARLWLFWGLAAVIVGPVLGVGAAWLRGSELKRIAAGVAPIAGILIGEGVYGLTRIADTTSNVYWIAELVVGLGILLAILVWRLREPAAAVLCVLLTAAVAVSFYVAYSGDLIARFG